MITYLRDTARGIELILSSRFELLKQKATFLFVYEKKNPFLRKNVSPVSLKLSRESLEKVES